MSVKLAHSFSSLSMFENCPAQYNYVRILKAVQNVGGEATVWGERIHKQLEDRLNGTIDALPPESSSMEGYVQAIRMAAEGASLKVEREATLNEALEPTGWFSSDAWMRSKLDVEIVRQDTAFVFDWKTGKRRPKWEQLELFALQVFQHYPEVDKVGTMFIWLKEGAADKKMFTRKMAPGMWGRLLERTHRVEKAVEANVWPAKPSGLCPYCPARGMCPVAR